jgi:HTH-type transcriptional regulator/antitoxin HipB
MADTIRTSGQLGPILKRLRKAKGWSQFDLGKKIGLSQERISVIENHPERVSMDQLLTLLMALEAELQIEHRSALSVEASVQTPAAGTLATKTRESW